MLSDNHLKPTKDIKRNGLGLVVFVVVLIAANLWIANDILSRGNSGSQLPSPKLTSAFSFVVRNESNRTSYDYSQTKNILVLGKSGGGYIAPDLTDTILIIHADGPLKTIKIISLPRDLAVNPVSPPRRTNGVKTQGGVVTKINALYQQGLAVSEKEGLARVKNKVEEVTGLATDAFVLVDLAAVEKVIDDIGGLNVLVKEDINDTRFPNDRGGYEVFKLEKGLRHLDGKTALKFVRTRHSPRGDFDRIERQQEVLKAIKGRVASLNPIWDFPKLWSIFRTIQKNVRTNLSLTDFRGLWRFVKNMDVEKAETFNLNPESNLVKPAQLNLGGVPAYVLVAKEKPFDYNEIRKSVKTFLEN